MKRLGSPSLRQFVAMSIIAVSSTSCQRESTPSGITCAKLPALHVGMPIEEVRRIVGSPPVELAQDGHIVFGGGLPETDRSWDFTNTDGVRLYLFFSHERLIGGESWIRTILRDMFDNESRPRLFRLDVNGLHEEPDFKRVYCPSS